ncbi:MAG: hypothetical protein IPP49_14020 [Saprospiraceae bacterium]|nr:hypothetical protein [Saprospiraceae bacterium]
MIPTPDVNDQPDILMCNMTLVSPLPFTSNVVIPSCQNTSITYSWTNSNPAIGLPASGTGNIPAFTATNPGTATITVIPSITLGGVTCTGAPISFIIFIHAPAQLV